MGKNLLEYADEQLKQLRQPAMAARQHPERVAVRESAGSVRRKPKGMHRARALGRGASERPQAPAEK